MKTQKIVLALALVAVTPAVLAAQDYVGGPGSKMSYIADNALAKIRQNHKESNPQNQNPVQQQPTVAPQRADTTPVLYSPYAGPEGKAVLAGENLWNRISARRQQRRAQKQLNNRHNNQPNNSAPTYVKDVDTLSRNHQVQLDTKKADKNVEKTNRTFLQHFSEIGQAIAREARYSK